MKLKYYPTHIHYCVPLSENQWECLTKIDARGDEREDVAPAIEKAGAINRTIEWNGHFGRNVFFACKNESTAKKVVRTLEKLLK